ncbi:ribosome hibernation-promoting factor, HPF/YfiA family [Paenibacillus sp. Z6-24]
MNFAIRGQHFDVTDAIKDYVDKKLNRLERYFDSPPVSDGMVTLSSNRGRFTVEVTIPLPGLLLRAEDRSEDMYASIDSVVDKLERQIRKHKTKLNRKFRQNDENLKSFFVEDPTAASLAVDEDADVEVESDEFEIVRNKRFLLKPMDVEEAILQMNLIGHTFFVFSNINSQQVNVVYRRDDGKYGLIEQE